jgi:hypothetical protein
MMECDRVGVGPSTEQVVEGVGYCGIVQSDNHSKTHTTIFIFGLNVIQ